MSMTQDKQWWLSIAALVMMSTVAFSAAAGWAAAARQVQIEQVALTPVPSHVEFVRHATPAPKK